MMNSCYAVVSEITNEVINTIIADSDFGCEGCYLIEIEDSILCQTGMYYNQKDTQFYYDQNFSQAGTQPASS